MMPDQHSRVGKSSQRGRIHPSKIPLLPAERVSPEEGCKKLLQKMFKV